jgi:hypothetical protein
MKTLSLERASLSQAHGRTIAIGLTSGGGQRILRGRGFYEADPDLGQVLRIRFVGSEDGEVLISEENFSGELLPGETVGCDYLIRLN